MPHVADNIAPHVAARPRVARMNANASDHSARL